MNWSVSKSTILEKQTLAVGSVAVLAANAPPQYVEIMRRRPEIIEGEFKVVAAAFVDPRVTISTARGRDRRSFLEGLLRWLWSFLMMEIVLGGGCCIACALLMEGLHLIGILPDRL